MRDIEGIDEVMAVLEPHWNEVVADFEQHNNRFLALFEVNHAAIGRVLRSHLVIENFINSFLELRYGLQNFSAARLTFFQKATLLPDAGSPVAFVRPGILQLNAVRNKFGHRLDHAIEWHEISSIYTVLGVARSNDQFDDPIDAIEAFAPIACAWLSVPNPELQELFARAFAHVHAPAPIEAE